MEAESDNESFILIEVNHNNGHQTIQQQVMFDHAQLTHSIISNQSNPHKCGSVDGWSEVSAPSIKSVKSQHSIPRKGVPTESTFTVYSGTYLHPPSLTMPGFTSDAEGNSEKGYDIIGTADCSQENMPIFSSLSSTENGHNPPPMTKSQQNDGHNANACNHNNNHSVGSVGSRVPFSYSEITKIKPQFHDDQTVQKPKVFDQTPKIRTRYRAKNKNKPQRPSQEAKIGVNMDKRVENEEDQLPMPAIPESDPFATKSDLGRRIRRSGKRGSRLKHPNGKRGGKRNGRRKNQK